MGARDSKESGGQGKRQETLRFEDIITKKISRGHNHLACSYTAASSTPTTSSFWAIHQLKFFKLSIQCVYLAVSCC